MRILSGVSAHCVIACALLPVAAPAQEVDILDGAPPTGIFVETDYDGNEGRAKCDWYASGSELLESLRAVSREIGDDCRINIRLRGILNREGAALFLALVAQMGNSELQPAAVILDSKGGDADAALAIARAIRGNDLFNRVPGGVATRIAAGNTAVCFSACIVIFAAGYRRSAEFNIYDDPDLPSRLGIHGPGQFDPSRRSYDTSQANREIMRIKQAFKNYFESVGVSPVLVDDMFAVPFNDIRLLSEADVRRYGL